jgi:hypothetical protein
MSASGEHIAAANRNSAAARNKIADASELKTIGKYG